MSSSRKKVITSTAIICTCLCVSLLTVATIEIADGQLCGKTCKAKKSQRAAQEASKNDNTIFQSKIFVSIITSKACKISENCVTVEELANAFDNSNKHLSGNFTWNDGNYERGEPLYPNAFELYRNGKLDVVVWVEPDDYTRDRTKNIIIERTLPVYIDRSDEPEQLFEQQMVKECTEYLGFLCKSYEMKLENTTKNVGFQLKQYSGIKIDDCKSATVGYKEVGLQGITDVVNHFMNNCDDVLEIDPEHKIIYPNTVFTDCSRHCQHLAWLLDAKEKAKDYLIPR